MFSRAMLFEQIEEATDVAESGVSSSLLETVS